MKKNSPPSPARPRCPGTLPIALAIATPGDPEWTVAVCPFCGDRHRHAPVEGVALSHCHTFPDVALTSRKSEYRVTLASIEQAEALRRITADRRGSWEIVNRHGAPLSRHRRLTNALAALTRWRRADRWASLRNRRIDAVAELLDVEQGGIGGFNLPGSGPKTERQAAREIN